MDNKKLLGTIFAVLILLGIGLLIGYLSSFYGYNANAGGYR